MVTIKLNGHTYSLEGNFEFYASPLIFNPYTFNGSKKISFEWNVEVPQDSKEVTPIRSEWAEMMSEKLKQDFKKTLLEDSFIPDPSFKVKSNEKVD